MNTENAKASLMASMNQLFSMYSPKEIEDTLFLAFERAHLLSDGDLEEDREKRMGIHTELRTIYRTIADSPQLIPLIQNLWTNNITETT